MSQWGGQGSRPRNRFVLSSRYAKAVPILPTVSCAGRATASETEWRKSREEATRTRVKIYQINLDRDQEHAAFLSRDAMQKFLDRTEVDPSVYDEVFNADLDPTSLEELFVQFNSDFHPLFRGRSMSVSDVVVIEPEGIPMLVGEIHGRLPAGGKFSQQFTDLIAYNLKIEELRERNIDFEAHDMAELSIPAVESGAFFCDDVGFEKIDFDERQTQKPDNLMRVVYVEPNREPFEAEILPDLEHLQKAVDGYIEAVYLDDGTIVVANEESKLRGMEGNRRIGQTIIAGPFFVCGKGGDDFCSLTDEEAARAMARFAEPEQISQAEVEADMGFTIITLG